MTGGPPPCTVNRSPDGEGLTVRDAPPRRPCVAGGVRGMPDEVPDEPRHLSLNADRVLRDGRRSGAAVPERSHVIPCDRGRTGQTRSCDHSGTSTDHSRRP